MGGKTGTAQVRRITGGQRGQGGDWKYRDHGLFIFFAPSDNPRYAGAVVIEHGLGGARAAAPVAKDVLTFLFDRDQGDGGAGRARAAMGRHAGRAHRAPRRGRRSTPPPAPARGAQAAHDRLGDHPAAAGAGCRGG